MITSNPFTRFRRRASQRIREIRASIFKGAAMHEALKRDYAALQEQVRELSLHSEEMELFGQLGEMLQACVSTAELCKVVSASAKQLFPRESGALYVLDPAKLTLEAQLSWGEPAPGSLSPFQPKDCWALRRGKPHYSENPAEGLFCDHVSPALPAFSLCLPLASQGGTLGLLHLRAGAEGHLLSQPRQLVATALAYQVALGLANLKLNESLREEAIRDPMTGLYNRRFMNESLKNEIVRAQRGGTSVGILSFDLDHFKEANDTLGHAAGDALLQGLAAFVKGSLRAGDLSCRQGGDEFLIILPNIAAEAAMALAEKLRQKAEQFIHGQFPSLGGKVTLSLGLAMYPKDASTPEALQQAADRALYRAKALGRNRAVAAGQMGDNGAEVLRFPQQEAAS